MKKLEICCGSVQDVKIVSQYLVDSIELNSALSLGGLTPSLATLKMCKEITTIPLYCMVRPIAGGFVYSPLEIETMKLEAQALLENGADGIVFGILNSDLTISHENQYFIDLANHYNKEAVFHRAFDLIEDQVSAYQQLLSMGFDRVLTSGGQPKAIDALERIEELLKIDPNHLIVGSGVNPANIKHFENIPYVHASCKELVYRCNGNGIVNYDYDESNTSWQVNSKCIEDLLRHRK